MSTVLVKNISLQTTEDELKEFFSFCGKISGIEMSEDGESKSASVTFERETAMSTALLLNNTQMGHNKLSVTSVTGATPEDSAAGLRSNAERDTDEITQEEKPRTRILAEYLAHGYVVGDVALKRAIDLDHKHGVSARFLTTLQGLDQKYHATEKAKATDASYGISQRAGSWLHGISSYFEKAGNTPTGQRIVQFYSQGSRQVQDIHAEARRLAELKKDAHGGSAYKASGLERVFGKEKEGDAVPAPAATGETTGTASSSSAAPTEGIPAAATPAVEKK